MMGMKNMAKICVPLCLLIYVILLTCPALGQDQSVSINITYPEDGSNVSHTEIIRGNVSANIPESQVVWIVVSTQVGGGQKYYPQNCPIDIQPNGNWSSTAWFGDKNESNNTNFTCFAILATEETQINFISYVKTGKSYDDTWPGIGKIPGKVCDRINVTRDQT